MKKFNFVKMIALILAIGVSIPFFTACSEEALSGFFDALESVVGDYIEQDYPAEATDVANFDFEEVDGGLAVMLKAGLKTYPEVITIPASHDGKAVVAVKAEGFKGAKGVKQVFIPKSVKSVGERAFAGITSLERMQFEKESAVELIDNEAFAGCTALTYASLPVGLKSIGNKAFSKCKLVLVSLPDGLLSIGECAFEENTALTISIPASVTEIGEGAFSSNYALTAISVKEGSESFTAIDGNLYSKDGKRLIQYCIANRAGSFTIPKEVEVIEGKAFLNAIMLHEIKFAEGSSLTTIKANAFENCAQIVSLQIPATVEAIEEDAFLSCLRLVEVINKSSNITIEAQSEENGKVALYALKTYNPEDGDIKSAISVDANGFITMTADEGVLLISYVGKSSDLVIPSTVTAIYEGALNGYLSSYSKSFGVELFPELKSVTIPVSVLYIGNKAFSKCEGLTTITYGGSVEEWSLISKADSWIDSAPVTKVICSDGEAAI